MAGAGYKLFGSGDILTAGQVNTYLNEQTVMVFATTAARDAALTSVLAEGMVCYIKDSNLLTTYDGSAWVVTSSVAPTYDTEVFTASGAFTKASYPWARAIRVRVVGGGGGGGGSTATSGSTISAGGGGGGGGYSEARLLIADLSASETVTVGAGGSGGAVAGAGGNGGDSLFGAHAKGHGGFGAIAGPVATPGSMAGLPGVGGDATLGDINVPGAEGIRGMTPTGVVGRVVSAGGGASVLGAAGSTVYTASGSAGGVGRGYGAGGTGGCNDISESGYTGGAGAGGIVIVEIYA